MATTTPAKPTPSRHRARRQTAAKSREHIIQEAEHLIHLRGYRGTSLEDIAARCRMTKANLLHHFRSKEDLGLAVLDFKIAATRKSCLECLFPEDADPFQAVAGLFSSAACFYRNNGCKAGCFIANIALEMSDVSDLFRERVSRFFEEWTSRIERNLRRHQALGVLRPGLEPRAAAEAILSLYEGAVMQARSRRDPEILERIGRVAEGLLRAHPVSQPQSKGGERMGPKTPCGC